MNPDVIAPARAGLWNRSLWAACLVAGAAGLARGQEEEPKEEAPTERSVQRLQVMTERAKDVRIEIVDGDKVRAPDLVERPCLRYSDEERAIADATLWIWADEGRPVAIQKMECGAFNGNPVWTVCFSSLTPDTLDVKWPRTSHGFKTTTPGCEFRPLPDAPRPADQEKLVLAQMRQQARRFGMSLGFGGGPSVARLLPRPVYEYSSPKHGIAHGAIFGYASYGTNPDGYILIELRDTENGQEWVYGCVRMTHYGLVATLDEQPVVTLDVLPPRPTYFENWTFFFEPRTDFVTP